MTNACTKRHVILGGIHKMPTGANLVLRPFQQLRQLGDIDGDAPRFGL